MSPNLPLLASLLAGDDICRRRLTRRELRIGNRDGECVYGRDARLGDFDGCSGTILDPHDAAYDIKALVFGDKLDSEVAGLDRDKRRPAHTVTRHDFRSEEHTSELQSLMRISYAVFCLKKKKPEHIDITKLPILQST